jgi:hypothetical protein
VCGMGEAPGTVATGGAHPPSGMTLHRLAANSAARRQLAKGVRGRGATACIGRERGGFLASWGAVRERGAGGSGTAGGGGVVHKAGGNGSWSAGTPRHAPHGIRTGPVQGRREKGVAREPNSGWGLVGREGE